MVRFSSRICLLLIAILGRSGAEPIYSYENKLRSLEVELIDLINDKISSNNPRVYSCVTTNPHDLIVTGEKTPSLWDIIKCNDQQSTSDGLCDEFDESQCDLKECSMGRRTDDQGCVVSCDCADEAIIEGDIKLTKPDFNLLGRSSILDNLGRAGSKFARRWNNIPLGDTYVVPYTLSSTIAENPRACAAISAAMEQYKENTCIRFRLRTNEKDYLEFVSGSGCWSYIGKTGRGKQQVSIGRGCEHMGIVMHELMHAIGFWHEHSRPDRDNKVIIKFENISPKFVSNFKKVPSRLINSFDSEYDIRSVMQYGGYFFSKNSKPTILDRKTMTPVEHQREGFSPDDVIQLNRMMNCKKKE